MAKERSQIADYAVYILVRFIVCIIQTLSYEKACRIARGLAWLAYRVDKRHRLVASNNLRQAFPERYPGEVPAEDIQAIYDHFCNLMIEIVHLPRRLHPTTWRRHLDLKGGRQFVEALLSGRPLMLVTGHFGNWEMGGYVLALLGFKTHAIARPLDNPYCDDFLRSFRERTGQGILAKNGDFEQIQSILAKGGVIATLADQDAGQRGLFVNFFGKPASTHKAVALLALEYKVPMLVMGVRKLGEPLRFQTVLADVIKPEEYDGRSDAVKAITQRYTTGLEQVVRSAPGQYFWLHRRWKHEPRSAKQKFAA